MVAQHYEVQGAIDLGHPPWVTVLVVWLNADRLALRECVGVLLRASRALHVRVERKIGVDVRVAPEGLAELIEGGATSEAGVDRRTGAVVAASEGGDREGAEG
jgi:hypothetical protein